MPMVSYQLSIENDRGRYKSNAKEVGRIKLSEFALRNVFEI
jgi:hypothetical protein